MTIPFVSLRKAWYAASIVLVGVSVFSLITNGIQLGSDFRGGAYLQVKTAASLEQVASAVRGVQHDSEIQRIGEGEYLIRFSERDLRTKIVEAVTVASPDAVERSFVEVSPTLTAEFGRRALTAIGAALIAISAYIMFAFRKVKEPLRAGQMGAATFVALAHDVIISVGFFSIMKFPADLTFIVAVLVVAAFSMHDTIVVFDRIRENISRRTGALAETVNVSLNETFVRSLNTSLTSILTLLAIFALVRGSLQPFIVTLIVGFVIGTYSSICLASQLLVDMNASRNSKQ